MMQENEKDKELLEKELAELTYEEALARLEKIVARLESGEATLDESMQLFQDGMLLARVCSGRLAAIEKKISQLIEKPDGSMEEKQFSDER